MNSLDEIHSKIVNLDNNMLVNEPALMDNPIDLKRQHENMKIRKEQSLADIVNGGRGQ